MESIMEIKEQKKKIRLEMLSKRDHLQADFKSDYDDRICSSLMQIIEDQKCRIVHTFLPMGSEINIFPFINNILKEKIKVVTPKTLKTGKLQHLILNDINEVENGIFGTIHPSSDQEYEGKYDIIIVPGLSADKLNNRLGYGGGYYDKFLLQHPEALKIGIFYPFQILESLPNEPHDVKLDIILIEDSKMNDH